MKKPACHPKKNTHTAGSSGAEIQYRNSELENKITNLSQHCRETGNDHTSVI